MSFVVGESDAAEAVRRLHENVVPQQESLAFAAD